MRTPLKNWTVQGYANCPLFGFLADNLNIVPNAAGGYITIAPSTPKYNTDVPCDIYGLLQEQGAIDNPFRDFNSLSCEWVGHRWWVYETDISYDEWKYGVNLVFECIDYAASVFINGKFAGRFENAYVVHKADLKKFLQFGEKARLFVMVEPAPDNLMQVSKTSEITVQKPRFNQKWDFCPRLASTGLMKPVYIEYLARHYIESAQIIYDKPARSGTARAVMEIYSYEGGAAELEYDFDGKTHILKTNLKAGKNTVTLDLKADKVKLWQPNGSGKAAIYPFICVLRADGKECGRVEYPMGFRDIEFVQNEDSEGMNALPYTFVVNGKKTYIKGVNLTPLTASVAECTNERYDKTLAAIKAMNVNLIRVWGGGIIESPYFYRRCSELGIMVWQDFMQSSSGLDNEPTVIPHGLEQQEITAREVIPDRRNYPCLALWCGGNELMYSDWTPVGYEHPNIDMHKKLIDELDSGRMFWPTTASGPFPGADPARFGKRAHHETHGPWTYAGEKAHYDFYNGLDCLFNAEFGADAFSGIKTVKKILSAQNLKYPLSERTVRHRAEWWNTTARDEKIFGPVKDLETLINLSQFVQAESLRYAIESHRRRAFNMSGSIMWQFNEPFPNLSCTNLMDYYYGKKAAYYSVARAYDRLNVSLKYAKLVWERGETVEVEVYLINDDGGETSISVEIYGGGKPLVSKKYPRVKNTAGKFVRLGTVKVDADNCPALEFILRASAGGRKTESRVMLLVRGENGFCSQSAAVEFIKRIT